MGAAVGGGDGVAIIGGEAVAPDRPGDRPFAAALAVGEVGGAGEGLRGDALAAFELLGEARQVTPADFDDYDLIVAMDRANERDLRALGANGEDFDEGKVVLLRSYDPEAVATAFEALAGAALGVRLDDQGADVLAVAPFLGVGVRFFVVPCFSIAVEGAVHVPASGPQLFGNDAFPRGAVIMQAGAALAFHFG